MTARMKQSWQRFEASKPGRRFQERYRRRQERGWRDPGKLFFLVGGLVIAPGSLLLGVLPGPGTLTFFVGLGMIAGEFRPVARLLNWAEVWTRVVFKRVGDIWMSSAPGKILVVSMGTIFVATVLYVAYLFLFGG
jgi:hypothetical protein